MDLSYEALKKQFIDLVASCEELHCPECDSDDVSYLHHNPNFLAPECDYWECEKCGYQWGHE